MYIEPNIKSSYNEYNIGKTIYDIIFENNNYSLTKNGVKKQTLLECNSRNILRVQELVGTMNIN